MVLSRVYTVDMYYGGPCQITGTVARMGLTAPAIVCLFHRQTRRCIRVQASLSGTYKFDLIAYQEDGYFVSAHDPSDFALNAAIQDRVTPTLDGVPEWQLPLLEGAVVSGQALSQNGQPADMISFRSHPDLRVRYNLVPEPDGAWSVVLPNGEWDITYLKDGCAPVCHGPFLIDAG